jgi:hypothetical protein
VSVLYFVSPFVIHPFHFVVVREQFVVEKPRGLIITICTSDRESLCTKTAVSSPEVKRFFVFEIFLQLNVDNSDWGGGDPRSFKIFCYIFLKRYSRFFHFIFNILHTYSAFIEKDALTQFTPSLCNTVQFRFSRQGETFTHHSLFLFPKCTELINKIICKILGLGMARFAPADVSI